MRQMLIPLGIAALVLGMFIPLPAVIIDYLLVINVCFALLMIFSVLLVDGALKLSTLPTILLLATLFRLMTNISTTRLLLTTGSPGSIIRVVGDAVIQNSLIVGLIIFLILTMVQLIVIAKGAERVAEVSARFTLDALPGKQMSIDADVRAGLIDFTEARQKRQELQTESRFYGALDGAMKFVKGDALVGLIITIINIIGGTLTGLVVHQLSLSQALNHYVLLTIGDGILSQIPAILNAVAAGVIVTRVVRNDNQSLSRELLQQLLANSQVRFLVIFVALIFACLPGIPLLPCLAVALLALLFKLSEEGESVKTKPQSIFNPVPIPVIKITTDQNELQLKYDAFRQDFYEGTGLIAPLAIIELKPEDPGWKLYLRGRLIQQSESIESFQADLTQTFTTYAPELLDDRLTRCLLEQSEQHNAELIANLIPEVISTTKLTCILRELTKEGISVRQFDCILQAIAEANTNDRRELLAQVRIKLKQQISDLYSEQQSLTAITLATDLDFRFFQAEKEGKQFEMKDLKLIVAQSKLALNEYPKSVLLCSTVARSLISDCFRQSNFSMPVVAYEEITQETRILSIKHIEHENITDSLGATM